MQNSRKFRPIAFANAAGRGDEEIGSKIKKQANIKKALSGFFYVKTTSFYCQFPSRFIYFY
jgi:hypothetical protein